METTKDEVDKINVTTKSFSILCGACGAADGLVSVNCNCNTHTGNISVEVYAVCNSCGLVELIHKD